ncbi:MULTISPECIES: hypothetical protein [Erwinia]|uniref:hypothetical protein n=1 Tax=Erwinia TaxID=551 RepID=UPI00055379D8|nr:MULTISPECIES: hypothetical protein [Erwinia]
MQPNPQDEEQSRHYPIEENLRWQRIEWAIQRVGYLLLFAVVILGACGLFSKGVLSDVTATSSDGTLQVNYERFGLRDSDMTMTIRVKPHQPGRFTLVVSGEEMENFQIQSLQPQPQRAVTRNNSLELTWETSMNDGATVWIGSQALNPGRYPVTITLDNAAKVNFTHYIYP